MLAIRGGDDQIRQRQSAGTYLANCRRQRVNAKRFYIENRRWLVRSAVLPYLNQGIVNQVRTCAVTAAIEAVNGAGIVRLGAWNPDHLRFAFRMRRHFSERNTMRFEIGENPH